jgi:hypothetical protein
MPRWLYRLLYRIGAWQIGPECEYWAPGYRQWRWDWATARREPERQLRIKAWVSLYPEGDDEPLYRAWERADFPRRDVARKVS